MNFFEHQDEARRSTRRLVVLFALAVFLLILITNLTLITSLWFFDASIFQQEQVRLQGLTSFQPHSANSFFQFLNLKLFSIVSLLVITIITLVIFSKRNELAGGGKVVAESLGGKKISLDTTIFEERQVLNVVEEMALASGVPVPPVYILEEKGINAFAAGFSPSDAVVGVSRGCVKELDRDQLQGVIAHEFSHILNGDMRLNINLIAVLAGILFIGHSGWFVVRSFGGSGRYRGRKNSGSAIVLVGVALIVIGFVGTFFGKLIKAAVSRQREFLADASAVQFTRNPRGIAGALKRIGGSVYGSKIEAMNAEEVSHLFFSNALKQRFSAKISGFFSTHPPLDERIKRIEPRWDGKFLSAAKNENVNSSVDSSEIDNAIVTDKQSIQRFSQVADIGATLASAVARVGETGENNIVYAHNFIENINKQLVDALKGADSAKAFVYLLLLNQESNIRQSQLEYLKHKENTQLNLALDNIYPSAQEIKKSDRLNLLELAIPALKQMTLTQYQEFLKNVVFLVRVDAKIDLFEWLLHSLLLHYLKPHFSKTKLIQPHHRNLDKLRNECRFLLSHLTYFGEQAEQQQLQRVFSAGFSLLDLGETRLLDREQLKLEDLNNAVYHFSHLYPLVKPKLLKACAVCIQADGVVNLEQYELLRVLSALLDCPMPLMDLPASFEKVA